MSFTLKDAVEMYASVADEPFTLETIMTALRQLFPSVEESVSMVTVLLQSEPCLFHDQAHDIYIPRAAFFRGARFLVIPSEYEMERDILITGDRLIPFCSSDIFPGKVALWAPNGSRIRRKRLSVPISEITEFLSLYGYKGIFNYLETDLQENAVALAGLNTRPPEKIQVQMAVYVMQDVYKEIGFQSGDGLVFTVQDWREGSFSVERVEAPLDNPTAHTQRAQWTTRMQDGFLQALERDAFSIEEQIAYAFFLGGRCLVEDPVYYVEGFLQNNERVAFVEEGASPRITIREREPAGIQE